jgi:hypothetical protein
MSLARTIACLLLTAFLVVIGGASMHAHETEIGMPAHIEAAADHGDEGGCTLCDVVKERVAVMSSYDHVVVHVETTMRTPVVRTLIDDRCPQERVGRAPPATA